MRHTVLYRNRDSHWDSALPLGNGVFGCMPFYEQKLLHIPMNHYEVYYNIDDNVLPEDILRATPPAAEPGKLHRDTRRRADANTPADGAPFCLYRTDKEYAYREHPYGIGGFSASYPPTGEVIFGFADDVTDGAYSLSLTVEDAKTQLCLESADTAASLQLESLVSRRDVIVHTVCGSRPDLLRSVRVVLPLCRDTDAPDVRFSYPDERTLLYTVRRVFAGGKVFTFTGGVRLVGATVSDASETENAAVFTPMADTGEYRVLSAVATDFRYTDTESGAYTLLCDAEKEIGTVLDEHREYWKQFFAKSSITLPDFFLEKVYTINQYALDCSSGKDGVMKHHACGLNGLWAIRHPNLWGSMWYWDVNIQAAFAGVFSSNRTDLGKVFSDGLLRYRELARAYARDAHNLPGVASDYPYAFYYSCWTWCAQYLWYQYEYTMDKEYLRRDAYPLFLELCEFTLGIFEWDEKKGYYSVYPDICPEQGPLAHDTTITVACAKYLFRFTLEAARILGDDAKILDDVRRVLPHLPPYALTKDGTYGVRLKDSPDAPDDLPPRHPSVLMPVFPIGEFDGDSDPETRKIVADTVHFLADHCEIGIFIGSWLSAAAARIGHGQTAYRLLYERGIDHMLRESGLSAEDTDRFMNFCLLARQPLYYPCMMEFTGEMLAAVNEMLLQSQNGTIRVFPAIPDGDREYDRLVRNGDSVSDFKERYRDYPAWRDVRFDRLLAKGAFEVSAALADRRLSFIRIHSRVGGCVTLTSPFLTSEYRVYHFPDGTPVPYTRTGDKWHFETRAGEEYIVALSPDVCVAPAVPVDAPDADGGISRHTAVTKRTVTIGRDAESEYQAHLDAFLRDRYFGNAPTVNHTVYKFDFTDNREKKYGTFFPIQTIVNQGHNMNGMDFLRVGADRFTVRNGYGFTETDGIYIDKATAPDALREDFVTGDVPTSFAIELPRGQYELLVVAGDGDRDSVTRVSVENARTVGGEIISRGEYRTYFIPVVKEDDDSRLTLSLSTKAGYRFTMCALFLNRVRGYI